MFLARGSGRVVYVSRPPVCAVLRRSQVSLKEDYGTFFCHNVSGKVVITDNAADPKARPEHLFASRPVLASSLNTAGSRFRVSLCVSVLS